MRWTDRRRQTMNVLAGGQWMTESMIGAELGIKRMSNTVLYTLLRAGFVEHEWTDVPIGASWRITSKGRLALGEQH